MQWARRVSLVAVTGWAVAAAATAALAPVRAGAIPVEPEAYVRLKQALLPAGVRAVATLPSAGDVPLLAVAYPDRIELVRVSPAYTVEGLWSLPVPAPLSVLESADLDGAGGPDLVAGTEGAGSVLWIRDALTPAPAISGASGFLFGPARRIVPANLDGQPPLELVVANAAGELFVYSAALPGGYRRVWRTPIGQTALAAAAGDLDGDGFDEVAVGMPGGTVRVLKWMGGRELVPVAAGYPWGDPAALAAVTSPQPGEGRSWLLVLTTRRLAYAYRLEGDRLAAEWQGGADAMALAWLRAQAAPPQAASPSGAIVFEGSGPQGIQVLRLDSQGLRFLAQTGWPGPGAPFVRLPGRHLAVVRPDGSVDLLQRVGPGYLEMSLDGRRVRPRSLAWAVDVPLAPVEELARLAGAYVTYEDGGRTARLQAGDGAVGLRQGSLLAAGAGVSVTLPSPPRQLGGSLYVPFEALQPLGWQVGYEPEYRRLTISSPWPQSLRGTAGQGGRVGLPGR